jgi:hypothetical protein
MELSGKMLLALRAIGSGVEHFLHTGLCGFNWEDAKLRKPSSIAPLTSTEFNCVTN